MRQVLAENKQFGYLNPMANQLLEQARTTFINADLRHRDLFVLSPTKTLWFTWTGTRIHQTILAMLEKHNIKLLDHEVAIELDLPFNQTIDLLRQLAKTKQEPRVLAKMVDPKFRRKYDEYLSEQLLEWSIAEDVIDINGAQSVMVELLKQFS